MHFSLYQSPNDPDALAMNVRLIQPITTFDVGNRSVCIISPDGKLLITAGHWMSVTIEIFNLQTYQQITILSHDDQIRYHAISPDNRSLVISKTIASNVDMVNELCIWDIQTRQYVKTLFQHRTNESWIDCCNISVDGQWLIIVLDDSTVQKWNLQDYKCVDTWKLDEPAEAMITPNNQWLITSVENSANLKIWDIQTHQCVKVLPKTTALDCIEVFNNSISPDGRWFAAINSTLNSIAIWDMKTFQYVCNLEGHTESRASCLTFSPDSQWLISGSASGMGFRENTLCIWNMQTRQLAGRFLGSVLSDVNCCAISPDGRQLVLTGRRDSGGDDRPSIWDISALLQATNQKPQEAQPTVVFSKPELFTMGYDYHSNCYAISPNGQWLVISHPLRSAPSIRIWDIQTRQCITTIVAYTDHLITFSPNGRWLLFSDKYQNLCIYDISTQQILKTLEGRLVSKESISADSQLLVYQSTDMTVRVWDLDANQHVALLTHESGLLGWLKSCIISPDGQYLVCNSNQSGKSGGCNLVVINIRTKQLVITLEAELIQYRTYSQHEQWIFSTFSTDGHKLVTGSTHHLYIWDMQNFQCLGKIKDSAYSCYFSADQRWLISVKESIRIWDMQNFQCVTMHSRYPNNISTNPCFSANGKWLVMSPSLSSAERSLTIWDTSLLLPNRASLLTPLFIPNTLQQAIASPSSQPTGISATGASVSITSTRTRPPAPPRQGASARKPAAAQPAQSQLVSQPLPITPLPESVNIAYAELIFNPSDISPSSLLGVGASAQVFKGKWGINPVAIKRFQLTRLPQQEQQLFIQELNIMQNLRHPNIVQLYGYSSDNSNCIVMELLDQGSLFNRLHSLQAISWPERYQWGTDIGAGLNFLHTQTPPILHRDLKSQNVLLNAAGRAKLGDFGLAMQTIRSSIYSRAAVGTPYWKAPELLQLRPRYAAASDIYAYGITMWEVVTQKIPYCEIPGAIPTDSIVEQAVLRGDRPEMPVPLPIEAQSLTLLITRMWLQDPSNRPSAATIVSELQIAYDQLIAQLPPAQQQRWRAADVDSIAANFASEL